MLLADPHYLQNIRLALQNAEQVDVAVAFWGAGADRIFESTEVKIRIVCNLLSGGTNPEPIALLRARANVEVRQCSALHAKLLLTDRRMIIGSANYSTNGLHYELEELQGWKELGFATQDKAALSEAKSWFEELWAQSKTIGDADLELAALTWKRMRHYRPIQCSSGPSSALPKRSEMVDRQIYLAIWGEEASLHAETEFKKIKTKHKKQRTDAGSLDFYEDFPELPSNASLIDIYIGPRHGVKINGVYRRVPDLDRHFTREKGEVGSIQIVTSEDVARELPFTFNKDFCKALKKHLTSASARQLLKVGTAPPLADLLE